MSRPFVTSPRGRCVSATLLAVALLATPARAQPPPSPKTLAAGDATRIEELGRSIDSLWRAGKFDEATVAARQAESVVEMALGTDDWQTAAARRRTKTLNTIAGLPEEGRREMSTIPALQQEMEDAFGKASYADAERLERRLLDVRSRRLGEGHPDTADSYNNLGQILHGRGDLPGAEAMTRRALATTLKALGEGHPDTATSYNNLGQILRGRGDLPGSEAMHRRALATRLKALGEGHPATATSYNNLARTLHDRGDLPGAEAMTRRALATRLKAVGEGHPATATSYSNLGQILLARGDLPGAEAMHRRALATTLKALGEGHPDTVTSYLMLGQTLDRLGKADEALDALTFAVDADELARLRGARGLEGAAQAGSDPSPELALALARAGRASDAWGRWERGLARALLQETAGRAARPLTPRETASEADLLGRSQAVDERMGRLAGRPRPTAEDETRRDDLRREAGELRRKLLDLPQALGQKYGPLAGKAVTLDEARAALPPGTALVGWVDTGFRHAACVLRRSGEPAWVMLPGTGRDGGWTEGDATLARRLREALAAHAAADVWRPLAGALAAQRLGPLGPHLEGVGRVVVVNSPGLAGVPVEVLFAARARAGEPGPTVAYAPSASMLTYLARAARSEGRPATLLAVGDPAYAGAKPGPGEAPKPPDHGPLVARVEPNGIADLFGVRPGDVLLEYDGTPLKAIADLRVAGPGAGPKRVPLRLWRAGEARTVEVATGPLGVVLDRRPATAAVLAQRAAAEVLHPVRGDAHARLPGTRREVAAIAGLFPADGVTTLLGGEARESVVQGLARSGKLKGFRYLHFAAHGRDDPRSAYRTALILAPDPDRSTDPAAFDTDGEITAEQIARTWGLDADLVVLSACESGLGLQAGGEGYLGFAQPLLARGARSLVLSLWKVEDRATALLMRRFYENLLGNRPGLGGPMPKAEALAEAKSWLRTRDASQAEQALQDAGLTRGERPGTAAPAASPVRPYEHPYFWAAFLLVGDPY